jgi:hypothetical protein
MYNNMITKFFNLNVIMASWSQLIYVVILTIEATIARANDGTSFLLTENTNSEFLKQCSGQNIRARITLMISILLEMLTVAQLGTNNRCSVAPEDPSPFTTDNH